MTKRRRLSPEEERLWKKVTDTATPLPKAGKPSIKSLEAHSDASAPNRTEPPATRFRGGQKVQAAATHIPTSTQPIRMDQKAFMRMRRGKSAPEARLDLHGMTVAAAHTMLIAFLLRAHSEGARLVLVITGKGKPVNDDNPIPRRVGVLRQQLPHWLDQPPLSQIVLQVSEAHRRHGGSGAFYVYLSRRR